MILIDGKTIAAQIREELKTKIALLKERKPRIAMILVGKNPASIIYVQNKKRYCLEVGIHSEIHEFPNSLSEKELLQKIDILNKASHVDGILIQLPLPKQISPLTTAEAISPEKDVDGFHPINMGKLLLGKSDGFIPCTPLGIITLLQKMGIDPKGKHVVILGRSNIVAKPLAALLLTKKPGANATVTIAHSATQNLDSFCRSADILVTAIGKAHFIKKEMVKKGAAVIDVGINRIPDPRKGEKIVGDVAFDEVKEKVSYITPVPGGVGPMTIAMLLQNTFAGYIKHFLGKKKSNV